MSYDDDQDPLRPARGILNALWMSVILWIGIVALALAIGWLISGQ